jgi:hypothetical protein
MMMSREAVPIVQAISKIGIVTGVARFGTVPEVIVVIVLHALNEKGLA